MTYSEAGRQGADAVEEDLARVDGHRVHYLAVGEQAPPLVLLHGGIIDAARLSWGAVVDRLATLTDRRVYAPDLLGYGESDRPDTDYTTARHVEVVEGLLDALDIDTAHVGGVSLGGGVGLGLAISAPERVERLVLVDSYGLGRDLPNGAASYALAQLPVFNRLSVALLRRSRRLARAGLAAIVEDEDAITDEVVDAFVTELHRPGTGRAFRRWRQHEVTWDGYRTVYTDRLEAVAAPTLLLHGAEDDLFPPTWSEWAARRLPDATLQVFEGCGHWLPRERPVECAEAIAAFLD